MIYFIRHGETEENRSFRLQGRKEIPMNANGIAQAKSAGEWFRDHHIVFTHVFSSPLGRAVQTA
ncbi:MAG: histidine phosphatase family protein, partial [Solobacterium sp.]|nr:histidine phosphatase family protein [Solobacterium sp.]